MTDNLRDFLKGKDALSQENPILGHIVVHDEMAENNVQYEGTAAIWNVDNDAYGPAGYGDTRISFMCLDSYGKYSFGNYASAYNSTCSVSDIKESQVNAEKKLEEFRKLHKESGYVISTVLYDDKPVYYDWDTAKDFPSFARIESSKAIYDLTSLSDVKSLESAEKWLVENHPDRWFGCSIVQKCPSGNFSMKAVPCGEYPKGSYETQAARNQYVSDMAAQKGWKVGSFDVSKNHSKRISNLDARFGFSDEDLSGQKQASDDFDLFDK